MKSIDILRLLLAILIFVATVAEGFSFATSDYDFALHNADVTVSVTDATGTNPDSRDALKPYEKNDLVLAATWRSSLHVTFSSIHLSGDVYDRSGFVAHFDGKCQRMGSQWLVDPPWQFKHNGSAEKVCYLKLGHRGDTLADDAASKDTRAARLKEFGVRNVSVAARASSRRVRRWIWMRDRWRQFQRGIASLF